MRKFVTLVVALVATLGMQAQTESAPLALSVGENTYTNTDFQNKTVVYYTYKNDTGSDQVLLLKAETTSTSFAVTADGQAVVHSEQADKQVFEVAKDVTVSIEVDTYSKTVNFAASLIATDLTTDVLQLPVKGTDIYLPSKGGNPMKTSYTAEETGLLCIAFNHAQTDYPYWEDQNGNGQNVGYESDFDGDKLYVAKMIVIAGQTYTISFNNAVPDLLNVYVDSSDDGTTIDAPFVGVIGDNVLPAKAGHYYYSLERKDYIGHRWMVFSSDASLEDGNLRVYTTTTDTQAKYSVDDYIAGRMRVSTSDANYYVRIEKTTDTASDEKFTISLDNDMLAEDSVATCPSVEAGQTYTVPHYNGTYYYRISIPSDNGTKYLVVAADKATHSTVQVGPSYQYETYIGKSTTGCLRAAVEAGQEYIITWKPNEGLNGFQFTVGYEDITAGEAESFPMTAEVGTDYVIPAGGQTRYYQHTATKACWIEAHVSDLDATVVFKKMGYNNITVGCQKAENVYRLRAAEGDSYMIVVTSADDDVTLNVAETDLGNGESAENALPISLGKKELTNEAQDIWYVYTAEQNGMLGVQSDIEYEMDPMNPTKGSDINVRLGSATATDQSVMGYDDNYNLVYNKEFAVVAGQDVYIHVKTYSAQENKSLELSMREYKEGESPLKPIELVEGENTLPVANSYYGYHWYGMDLEAGDFTISQPDGKAFNFDMYKFDDTVNKVATTQREGEFGAYTYTLTYTVTEPGRYVFQLTNAQEGEVVVVGGTATDGIESLTPAISKEKNAYNLQGQQVGENYRGVVIKNGKKYIVK